YRSVAIDAGPLARALVAWRLQDGGNWIERLPMPGAGWTKDCDRWPTDCCRYMHQPRIIRHRNVSHSKSKDRIAQIGSGEAARTASAGRHDRFCDWRFVRPPQTPDLSPVFSEFFSEFAILASRPCFARPYRARR